MDSWKAEGREEEKYQNFNQDPNPGTSNQLNIEDNLDEQDEVDNQAEDAEKEIEAPFNQFA